MIRIGKNSKTISTVGSRNLELSPTRERAQGKGKIVDDRYNHESGDKSKMSVFSRKRRERFMSVLEKYAI